MGGNNPTVAENLTSVKEFEITGGPVKDQNSSYAELTQEFPSLYAWSDTPQVILVTNCGTVVLTDLAPIISTISREPYTFSTSTLRWVFRVDCDRKYPIVINSTKYITSSGVYEMMLGAGESFSVTFAGVS